MSKRAWLGLICLCLMAVGLVRAERGVVVVKDETGQPMQLYSGSYALLVGISKYDDAGWSDLPSVPGELKQVEDLLKSNGFHVDKKLDLDSEGLFNAFQSFIKSYGFNPNNRLLFYFSGHGHTYVDEGQGYLVAKGTPKP